MDENILSVKALNEYVAQKLNSDFFLKRVSIRGEISNIKIQSPSGHMYFSLKDEDSAISCTMWRSSVQNLRFVPQNGQKVVLRGQVTVYIPNGRYQIVADSMKQEGTGDLYAEFIRLKNKLQAEGLFDQVTKKPIPLKVKTIGVATSSSGAALRDIIKVSKARNPRVNIVIAPCSVQGKGSENEIAASIRSLDAYGKCDVILVGRGGGSMEDLWAFNEEAVARAVYECRTPIISCVGHETDFSICDFVADLRASTPSNAAEIAVCNISQLYTELVNTIKRLNNAMHSAQKNRRIRLEAVCRTRYFTKPREALINDRVTALEILYKKLPAALEKKCSELRVKLENEKRMLENLNPDNVKKRGYACVRVNEALVGDIFGLKDNDDVTVEMLGGEFESKITRIRRNENG